MMNNMISGAVDKALEKMQPTCLYMPEREVTLIRQALTEMYLDGQWEPESDSQVVEVKAEGLMMRLRRLCLLGIDCQIVIKQALIDIFRAGAES